MTPKPITKQNAWNPARVTFRRSVMGRGNSKHFYFKGGAYGYSQKTRQWISNRLF
jgi:hypothetical protein